MSLLGFVGRALRAAVWVLIAAGLVVFGWIWLISDPSGQEKMMMTVPLLMVMGLLAVVALVMVRGPWRRIARGAAAVLLAVGLAMPLMFRLKGLTGDFFPVLEYRFAPKHDTTLPELPGETKAGEPSPADTIAEAPGHEGAKDNSGAAEPSTPAPASAKATAGENSTPAPSTPAPSTRHPAHQHPALRHLAPQHI